ncbi:hypothetical protein [Pseudaquidulcibacter saccharophilus]|uniref:hypothetical protein n=1 Tax=Pseudaquidulcibacter saccharophilus TaxID=2831900 RepID=UPI001EFF5D0F|nr:hypothetical protein [Pseudaquidulcibacter saccharophilus]
MISKVHKTAAIVAFLCLVSFWTLSLITEINADKAFFGFVRTYIFYTMFVMIAAIIITAVTGFKIAKKMRGPIIENKKKRMPFIGLNGAIVLLPLAIILFMYSNETILKGQEGMVDTLRLIELIFGAINIILISLNIKDGLKLKRK